MLDTELRDQRSTQELEGVWRQARENSENTSDLNYAANDYASRLVAEGNLHEAFKVGNSMFGYIDGAPDPACVANIIAEAAFKKKDWEMVLKSLDLLGVFSASTTDGNLGASIEARLVQDIKGDPKEEEILRGLRRKMEELKK